MVVGSCLVAEQPSDAVNYMAERERRRRRRRRRRGGGKGLFEENGMLRSECVV